MTEPVMSYAPGTLVAVAGRDAWLLVAADVAEPETGQVWSAVLDGGDTSTVLDVMTQVFGISSLPGFALVVRRDGGEQLEISFRAPLTAAVDGEAIEPTAGPWTSFTRPAGTVTLGPDAPTTLPLGRGVGLADTVSLALARPGSGTPNISEPVQDDASREAPAESQPDPVDERTVARPSRRAKAPTGPTVLAASCPQGHLTPAFAPLCRVCQQPLPQPPEPVKVPRPALGRLHFSTGEQHVLDTGVIIGRAPQVPADATDPPALITVGAGSQDVSRQHVELRLEGWNVYLQDLGSVNGTFLDDSTEPLAPHVLTDLLPGQSVNIGDAVTFRFDPVV